MSAAETQIRVSRPTCLLCGGERPLVVNELAGRQLRALWGQLGQEYSPEAWGKITEAYMVEMLRCQCCGYTYFDPDLAGNEAFYRQREREGYYSPTSPEFPRTNAFARRHGLRRVLDVGCGSGFYLDLARTAGLETCGLELNRSAAAKAKARGHKIYEKLLPELDQQEVGQFDLITFFQVLEHVPNPLSVMKQAAGFLRPGGCIAVAVPSAQGAYRWCPWDPHQWPPHHVSHWRLADFDTLAKATKLLLLEQGGDVLEGSRIKELMILHNQLAPQVGGRPRLGGKALPGIISQIYRKTGLKHVFPQWGSSIYAFFQKP